MRLTYPTANALRSKLHSPLEAALVGSEDRGTDRQRLVRARANRHIVGIKLEQLRILRMVK